jgi:hypothetical protein
MSGAIKFCFRASLSATETQVSVQKAYGNKVLKKSNVFRLYSRFGDGRKLVDDDERGGRPKSTQTEVNITAVADLVKFDSLVTLRMIAESLNAPETVIPQILKEDLGRAMFFNVAQ